MKHYKDLDLQQIRDECGLDFAHFTYQKGQCSCCYGAKDQPAIYWKNHKIPEGDNYSFILFKNAYNGSGTVTKNDIIEDYTCVSWDFDITKLHKVCELLRSQLDSDYIVVEPVDETSCIIIRTCAKIIEQGLADKYNLSPYCIKRTITRFPSSIKGIKYPDEELQLIAVKSDVKLIKDIAYPRREACKYIVTNYDLEELFYWNSEKELKNRILNIANRGVI